MNFAIFTLVLKRRCTRSSHEGSHPIKKKCGSLLREGACTLTCLCSTIEKRLDSQIFPPTKFENFHFLFIFLLRGQKYMENDSYSSKRLNAFSVFCRVMSQGAKIKSILQCSKHINYLIKLGQGVTYNKFPRKMSHSNFVIFSTRYWWFARILLCLTRAI